MSWGVINDLLYVTHETEHVLEESWRDFLADVKSRKKINGILVFGILVKPDVEQRGDIRDMHERFGTKLAIITRSKLTMGVLTAIRWFGVPVRGFDIDQLAEAHVFLGREDMIEEGTKLLAPLVAKIKEQ